MVSITHSHTGDHIVLVPNRSLSWRGNQYVILSLLLISMVISIGFGLMGAWMILPFAGLEIASLTAALYYVSWKLSYRQVIRFQEGAMVVEKGVKFPSSAWTFDPATTEVRIVPPRHDWDGPEISFVAGDCEVEVGEFLNKDDRETLLSSLRARRLPVRVSERERVSL